ncbi:MAG: FAD-dependent oxidoreductase [Myxococcales bacterium]|nr:MAG: FAD-dependent oxidoreductase [Myxococcales bacterium]
MNRIYPFEEVSRFDLSTDVLVAGFGGAGASAALEARRAGAEVVVLERASDGGGSTMMSACEMYLGGSGGTRLQRDLGFSDSTRNFFDYLMACFGHHADEARVRVFAEGAAEHFDWAEGLGVKYKRGFFPGRDVVALTGDSLQYTGNEKAYPFSERCTPVPRGHLPADSGHKGGVTLMTTLMKRVEEAGADIRCDARMVGLIQDADGRVHGGVVRIGEDELFIEALRGVVLCMGGFIMNEAMTRRHIPHVESFCTRHGNPYDLGDGILMGVAAGGHAIHMGEAFISIAHYPPESLTFGIFVNDKGQRFVNEDAYLARIGHYASVQPGGRIFMFIDDAHFARPRYVLNTEIVGTGDTVTEVEREAGLPDGALQSTVALYNEHAAHGSDPLFHKAPQWLTPLDQPPYALVSYELDKIVPAAFTLGGLDTLPTGEVVTPDQKAIPGLYAAGRTAAGIPRTSKGYASGMSVADATFFGRLAGKSAANRGRETA